MDLTTLFRAAAIAATVGVLSSPASAVPLTGQLDLVGTINLNNSDFTPTGQIDFASQTAFAMIATGSFSPVNTVEEGSPTLFTLIDIDFTSPGLIYDGGGFSFTAGSFFDFDSTLPGLAFKSLGTLHTTLAGFDPTPGQFSLSVQDGATVVSFSSTTTVIPLPASALLLLASLGGLGLLGWRRRTAAA